MQGRRFFILSVVLVAIVVGVGCCPKPEEIRYVVITLDPAATAGPATCSIHPKTRMADPSVGIKWLTFVNLTNDVAKITVSDQFAKIDGTTEVFQLATDESATVKLRSDAHGEFLYSIDVACSSLPTPKIVIP